MSTITIAMIEATCPRGSVEERVEMVRVDEDEKDEDADRDGGDDPAREPSLRRQHRDQPPQVHPRANVGCDLIEHLRRVPARLALHECEDGDLIDVDVLHALPRHLERLVERNAELLVRHDAAELALGRLGRLVRDDTHRAREAVPRTKSRREDVEILGQLLAELPSLTLRARLRT